MCAVVLREIRSPIAAGKQQGCLCWARLFGYFVLTSLLAIPAKAQTELITNGGFESGSTGWILSGAQVSSGAYPRTGSSYAILGATNNALDQLYQTFSIPSNVTSATLSFWYNITSQETGSTPFDVLNVTIKDTNGNVLASVDTYSNVDQHAGPGNPYYVQETFNLTPYIGQTVQLHFLATTDGSLLTWFRVDDVSVLATGCSYTLQPTSRQHNWDELVGTFNVNAPGGCTWTPVANNSWISTSGGGTGNGVVAYSISPNSSPNQRTGTITVETETFTIIQNGQQQAQPPDLEFDGPVTVSPSTATAGGYITVSYAVRNDGDGDAGYSHTKIRLKDSGGAVIKEDVYSTDPIPAQTSISQSHVLTIPATAEGSYEARVVLDNYDVLDQTNTNNDFASGFFSVRTLTSGECVVAYSPNAGSQPGVVASSKVETNNIYVDGFDYPFADKGINESNERYERDEQINNDTCNDLDPPKNTTYPNNPCDDPERGSNLQGWRISQDVGAYLASQGGVHAGEDWSIAGSGDVGEVIYAAANGEVMVVEEAFSDESVWAYTIVLKHVMPIIGSVYYSFYTHITTLYKNDGTINDGYLLALPHLQRGDHVSKGDSIAVVAYITGNGPHLHFEIRDGSRWSCETESCDLYVRDLGNSYFADRYENCNGPCGRNEGMQAEQVQVAYQNMVNYNGILDASDFIDTCRYIAGGQCSSVPPETVTSHFAEDVAVVPVPDQISGTFSVADLFSPLLPDLSIFGARIDNLGRTFIGDIHNLFVNTGDAFFLFFNQDASQPISFPISSFEWSIPAHPRSNFLSLPHQSVVNPNSNINETGLYLIKDPATGEFSVGQESLYAGNLDACLGYFVYADDPTTITTGPGGAAHAEKTTYQKQHIAQQVKEIEARLAYLSGKRTDPPQRDKRAIPRFLPELNSASAFIGELRVSQLQTDGSVGRDTVWVGQMAAATDGWDPGIDALYISLPSSPLIYVDESYGLDESYKSTSGPLKEWPLFVSSTTSPSNAPNLNAVDLSWDMSVSGSIPAGATLELLDDVGNVVVADMRTTTNLSLSVPSDGTYWRFTVRLADGAGGGNGSIGVTIIPPAAVTAGAQWKLVGTGTWRNSGDVIEDLPLGTYIIEYRPIPGWQEPTNLTVEITQANPTLNLTSEPYVEETTVPTVVITSPTTESTYTTTSDTIDLAGTAAVDGTITTVTWQNDRGGSGTASGTTNWSITGIPLQEGVNVITVTAEDSNGATGSDQITVTFGTTSPGSTRIIADDRVVDDEFGRSIAIQGTLALIGASGDDNDAGSAYVFSYNGTGWDQEQKLIPSVHEAGAEFGYRVVLNENADMALISADEENDRTGAIYVFQYNGSSWIETQNIVASGASSGHLFGCSLSLDGDWVLAGACGDGKGAVYAFEWSGTVWVERQKLTPPNPSAVVFGADTSIRGDLAFIGDRAFFDAGTFAFTGAVFVYHHNGTSWVYEDILLASDRAQDMQFGRSVATDGEWVFVGAASTGSLPTSTYVFQDVGGVLVEQQQLMPSSGESVAVDGSTLIVSDVFNGSGGAAHIYHFDGSAWTYQEELSIDGTGILTERPVAISGDVALVGYRTDDDDMGSVWAFTGMGTGGSSNIRYVDPSGNDSGNDCTNPAEACATITHAISQANDGDTIDLAPGTYNEPGLVIDKALNFQGQGVIVQ